MSESERPVREETVAAEILQKPKPGQPPDQPEAPDVDHHASWLKEWRSLRSDVAGQGRAHGGDGALRELRDNIAHTPAMTLAGLQAQAELISELAWNDVVAATARQLLWGIKRLRQDRDGCQ